MHKNVGQNALIFQVSLTEIMLLFVFVLLIISVIFHKRLDDYKSENMALVALLGNNVKHFNEMTKLKGELKDEDANDVIMYSNEVFEELNNIIKKKLDLKEEWSEFELYREYLQEHKNTASLIEKFNETSNSLEQCKASVKNLQTRCGKGFPSCELHSNGRQKYLFDLTLYEDSIYIKYLIKKNEIQDTYLDRNVPYANIQGLFEKYDNWSRKQEVECRFFVKVRDATKTKDSYKTALKIVERSFYKKEFPLTGK